MKTEGVLNSNLARIIAGMGHTDKLVVCDIGLPIPNGTEVVDMALTNNIPRFIDTLKTVLKELTVESAIVTNEMVDGNPELFQEVKGLLSHVDFKKVNHEKFKNMTRGEGNITFVRTGEATPYANIILVSGVHF
ncbi:MAG: D-ribose pyranase [Candidatus Marinimicrobia bacterium]|nr:D-ribose pyranase [Candidatus Neomarinimicrobiota bacterium]